MHDWLQWSILIVTQLIILVGLFGLIVPIFPGTVVIWLASLGYGVVTGFTPIGTGIFIGLTLLMLVSTVVDNLMMGLGARQQGASWLSIGVALLAGIIGTLALPPIGGILAAPAGVLLLEYARHKDWKKAWHALRGLATGWGLSFVMRFGIGVVMMVLWWLWVWKGS